MKSIDVVKLHSHYLVFFFQAEDGIRDLTVTGVQTCALPIYFLYITCALFEALLFTKLSEPRMWFTLGAIYSAVGWFLFVWDFRLIRARERDSGGPASNRLSAKVRRDQRWNAMLLLPAVFALSLICA